MPRFGQFETVDELASAGPVTVYSARKAGDAPDAPPAYAVKTYRAHDEFADRDFTEAEAARFLAVANTVKAFTSASGGGGWAPVHETGREGDFAFWVTDLYASTVDRLIESRREVELSGVVRIARGILDGLITLRDAVKGRGHGHMRPSNVLLSNADPNDADVFLVDALADDRLPANAVGEDLRALGGMIYQLVCRKPPPKGGSVQRGAEWSNLGPAGEKLRVLTEQLLNPQVTGTLTLEQVADGLKVAVSAGTGKSKKPMILALATVVLLAGAAAAYFATRKPPPPPEPSTGPITISASGEVQVAEVKVTSAREADKRDAKWKAGIEDVLKTARTSFEQAKPQLAEESGQGDTDIATLTARLEGVDKSIAEVLAPSWDKIPDPAAPGGLRDAKGDDELQAHHQTIVTRLNEVGKEAASIFGSVKAARERTEKARRDFLDASVEEFKKASDIKLQDVRDVVLVGLNKIPRDDATVGWKEARARVASIIEWGKSTERDLGSPRVVKVPPELNASIVNAARDRKQIEMVDAVLAVAKKYLNDGKAPVADDESYKAQIATARATLDTWIKAAEQSLQDTAAVKNLLSLGYGFDEPGPGSGGGGGGGGGTIKSLAERAGSDKAILKDLSSAITDTLDRAVTLGELSAKKDAPALLSAISANAGTPDNVSTVVSAWQRLRAAPYPVKPSDLADAAKTFTSQVLPAINNISNADRKNSLTTNAQSELRSMWFDFVHQRAGAEGAGVETAFRSMADLGVTEAMLAESLEPFAAFNYERWKFMNVAKALKPTGGEDPKVAVQGIVRAFDAALANSKAKAAIDLGPAKDLRERVLKPYREAKYFDASAEGPGKKGWTGRSLDENENSIVGYSWKGHELFFRKIPERSANDAPSYVCTTEVSLDLFIDLVSASNRWPEFYQEGNQLIAFYNAAADNRLGPVVWRWSDGPILEVNIPARDQAARTGNGWLRYNSKVDIPSYYPAGFQTDPPPPNSPMNRVAGPGSAIVAALAGCRLPSSEEWRAAMSQSSDARASANVRDSLWTQQLQFISGIQGTANNAAEWPNGGIFRSKDEPRERRDAADNASSRQDSDGFLWFRPVPKGAQDFKDLIGNVAEWVFENPAGLDQAGESMASVKEAIGKGEQLFVIGGSALSPPASQRPDDEPLAPRSTNAAVQQFSDVGFRLAFTAQGSGGGGNPAERLAQILASRPYLTRDSK